MIQYIGKAIIDINDKGFNIIQSEVTDMYIKKHNIFNVQVTNTIIIYNISIQNFFSQPHTFNFNKQIIYNKIFSIIQQHKIFDTYLSNKNLIISKIISQDGNLKKANKKKNCNV